MVHSVSGWTRGVQVKLWDPLRTRAMPERLRGVFTTRHYTNPRLPLPYLTFFPSQLITFRSTARHIDIVSCGIFSSGIWRLRAALTAFETRDKKARYDDVRPAICHASGHVLRHQGGPSVALVGWQWCHSSTSKSPVLIKIRFEKLLWGSCPCHHSLYFPSPHHPPFP